MAPLLFGFIWLLITLPMAFSVFTTTDEPMAANLGVLMFPLIGIVFFGIGLKKLIRDVITSARGTEGYGVIVDIRPTGTRVNGRREYRASVIVIKEDRTTQSFSEIIGFDRYMYNIGEVVNVKYYKNDVNIIGTAVGEQLPYSITDIVEGIRRQYCSGNVPYSQGFMNNLYGMNGGYTNNGMNNPYGMNGGYANNGMNNPYGMNGGYANNGMNNPNGMNGGYANNGANNPYGMNSGYGNNGTYDTYGANNPYGTNNGNNHNSMNDSNNNHDNDDGFNYVNGADIYGNYK